LREIFLTERKNNEKKMKKMVYSEVLPNPLP